MSPDESLFICHLDEAPFQDGVDRGRWGLHGNVSEMAWPSPVIWIRSNTAYYPLGRLFLRFDMSGYPQSAPTARPWDIDKNLPLEAQNWPKGPGNVSKVFNPNWKPDALYAPCDRIAMNGHDRWANEFPRWWWQPSFTIARYLEFIYQCLN